MALAITEADATCVPLNLHRAVADLAEFASGVAELHPDDGTDLHAGPTVAELQQEITDLKALLVQAGVIPAQAPSPAQPTA